MENKLAPFVWKHGLMVVDLREVCMVQGRDSYGNREVVFVMKNGARQLVAGHNNAEGDAMVKSAVGAFEAYLETVDYLRRL